MGWFTKLLKGSNHKSSGWRYQGKYGDDRYSNNHDYSVDDLTDFGREEIDRAIALALSEEDQKGEKVIEDDSQSEDDEELCPLDDEEDDHIGDFQQDEDDHLSKIQHYEDKHLDEVQLEEDEQLARAIQESLSVGSPPPSHTDSIFQPFSNLFPPVYRSEGEDGAGERWVEVISWEPRALVYHNFLTKEECEYLINIAKPGMHKSTVVDSETGKSKDSRVRTSSGTFLARGQDEIVRNIEKRIADFTCVPVEHGEGLQVLHYEVGQEYEPHYDYFMDEYNTRNGGQRIATVLMYLSDVEEGGETVFPAAKGKFSSVPWYNELSDCGKKGLSIKPKMGDALLFWSIKPDATLDPSSLHGACPVIKGDKWSCTKWMRVKEYKPKYALL